MLVISESPNDCKCSKKLISETLVEGTVYNARVLRFAERTKCLVFEDGSTWFSREINTLRCGRKVKVTFQKVSSQVDNETFNYITIKTCFYI